MTRTSADLPPRRPRLRIAGIVAFGLRLLVVDALILVLLADEAPYVVPVADALLIAAYVGDEVRKHTRGAGRGPGA